MAGSEPAPGPLPCDLHVAAGSGMGGGSRLGPVVGPLLAPDAAPPRRLCASLADCPAGAAPLLGPLSPGQCGGFVGAHPEAFVRPASSRRGLRGSEAKAAHAQSPPASSLHLVVARAGSHKGPKQGSQGAQQGKGPPSPTAAGGWGLSRAAGRRAIRGGGAPLPFPQLTLERRVAHSLLIRLGN